MSFAPECFFPLSVSAEFVLRTETVYISRFECGRGGISFAPLPAQGSESAELASLFQRCTLFGEKGFGGREVGGEGVVAGVTHPQELCACGYRTTCGKKAKKKKEEA